MDYRNYDIEDFLQDEFFVSWVINPNKESDHFWNQWISTYPEKHTVVEQAKELVKSIKYKEEQRLSEAEYTQVFESVLKANRERNNRSFIWQLKHTMRLAATIALLIAAAIVLVLNPVSSGDVQSVKMLVAKTEPGQKRTIKLSDGTTVMLNAGSSLVYPELFSDSSRMVTLFGEAFFDVEKDPSRPFEIESNNLITRVLGTSFNVRSYPEEATVSVAVMTGRVEVKGETGKSEILLPEDMGIFDVETGAIEKSHFDETSWIGWTKGILVFDNQTLPEIFKELENWYGVKIEVQKGMKLEGRYSGQYLNKSLEVILEGISYTSHFKYSINQKTILIYDEK